MSAVVMLVLAIGDVGSPVDQVLPETIVLRIRMLGLRVGMPQDEVSRRLGLQDRVPSGVRFTVSNSGVYYPIGKAHILIASYSLNDGRELVHGLRTITLELNPPK
jgi:hypothetical protein